MNTSQSESSLVFKVENHKSSPMKLLMNLALHRFPDGIPFVNELTQKVEITKSPLRGNYPIGLLAHIELDHKMLYKPTILHNTFSNASTEDNQPNSIILPVLRPYQIPLFQEICQHYNKCLSNNIPCVIHVEAPCGFGKSEVSMMLIAMLRIRTVIVVKTKVLVSHWIKYLERYNIDHYGSYDGSISLMKNVRSSIPDVLVVVSRHFENTDFLSYINTNYSMCLIDEIHSWNLSSNSELSKFVINSPLPVNIYLTATPNLTDRTIYGKSIKATHPPSFETLVRKLINYSKRDHTLSVIGSTEQLDNFILSDVTRNSIIITCIIENITECNIVYCNRRLHVDILYNSVIHNIKEYNIPIVEEDSCYVIFNIKGVNTCILKGDAEAPNIHNMIKNLSLFTKFTLISTIQFCACGLDLPRISNVILAVDNIDSNTLKQAVGRAERAPYDTVRKTFIFWCLSMSNNKDEHNALRTKKLSHNSRQVYTTTYNKFLKDNIEIKNRLLELGWQYDPINKNNTGVNNGVNTVRSCSAHASGAKYY